MSFIKKIFHSSPRIVTTTYSKLYSFWSKIRSLWLPIHLYKGTLTGSSNTLYFAYFGWNPLFMSYWLVKMFDQYEQVPGKKRISAWRINRFLSENKLKCDMAIVELSKGFTSRIAKEANGFILPRWLKMYLDIERSLTLIRKGSRVIRRIRQHSLEVEYSSKPEDFKFFYERMHKPYIQKRHNDSAFIEDYKDMLNDFNRKESTIYFILKDGVRVAALYEQNAEEFPHMYAIGVLDASPDIMKLGVVGALYYYSLENHHNNNISRVNIGGTSPLLTDGLTKFKLSLGAFVSEIENQDSIRLNLIPLTNSSGVEEFLSSNAFIYFENGGVDCAMFRAEELTEESEIAFQKQYDKTSSIGVKKTSVFVFDKNHKFSKSDPLNYQPPN